MRLLDRLPGKWEEIKMKDRCLYDFIDLEPEADPLDALSDCLDKLDRDEEHNMIDEVFPGLRYEEIARALIGGMMEITRSRGEEI